MSRRIIVVAGLLGLTGGSPALAQQELEAIVVEGTTLDETPVPLDQTGSAVTVVTGEQLQRQQIRQAADALRSLPGVNVTQNGSIAGLTQVRIRGAEGNHTLVLIDGIEANATVDGEFDFSDLQTEDIERIEVIRGPQSGLYGSSALAGVVNIITRSRRGPLQIVARGETGAFETRDAGFSVSAGNDDIYGAVTATGRETDGFNIAPFGTEEDGAEVSTVALKGGVKVFPNLSVDAVARHVSKDGDRDTEGGLPGTLAVQTDNPSTFASDIWLAGAEAKLDTFGGKWVHRFKGNLNETTRGDEAVSDFGTFRSENYSESQRAQYLSTYVFGTPGLGGEHRITGLLEHEEEGFTPVLVDNIERQRARNAGAIDYHGVYFKRLTLDAAYRHDDNDTLEDFDTYRVAGSLDIPNTPWRVHASTGTGVKFPTLFEQFGFIPTLFQPNPNLLPEESLGWDAGVETRLLAKRLSVDVTYFEADLENEIVTRFLPTGLSTVENLTGVADRRGVEVAAWYQVFQTLRLGAAYTYLDAKQPDGQAEIRRPRHSGRGDVQWGFNGGRGTVTFSAIYNGETEDLAFLLPFFTESRVLLDEYVLGRLTLAYKMRPNVELFGRVENLFDDDYQELFGYETAGLAAYGGVKVVLGGGS